jgi:hypothetical protein
MALLKKCFLDFFSGIRPACSAGFQTCRAADFQIGTGWNVVARAGLEARDTADLEVCATRQAFSEWRQYPLKKKRSIQFPKFHNEQRFHSPFGAA